MQKIIVQNTNLQVSRLGYGTASLHHLFYEGQRRSLLSKSLDLGFTHFDTSRIYGEGIAESSLGNFLSNGLRKNITLATKIGIPVNFIADSRPILFYALRAFSVVRRKIGGYRNPKLRPRSLSKGSVEHSLFQSLKALKTDWVDVLFIHEPTVDEIPLIEAISEWLYMQKRLGRARYLGLSGNALDCVRISRSFPGLFDILQVEDSVHAHEADVLIANGMPLQLTYGYLRSAKNHLQTDSEFNYEEVLNAALNRNDKGLILISSTSVDHLKKISKLLI